MRSQQARLPGPIRCDKFLTSEDAEKVRAVPVRQGAAIVAGRESLSSESGVAPGKNGRSCGKITRRLAGQLQAGQASGAADVALPAQLQDWRRRWQAHCVGTLWTFKRDHGKWLPGGERTEERSQRGRPSMNFEQLEGKWKQYKGQARAKWGHSTKHTS